MVNKMFDLFNMWKSWGMLEESDVNDAVIAGLITEDQYKDLMGKEYMAPTA